MRFPITIRSRGNWSVLYVRIVCVTTLPKCLVHMVSNLKHKEMNEMHYFHHFTQCTFSAKSWSRHKRTHFIKLHQSREIHTTAGIKDFKTNSAFSYSIRVTCYLNWKHRRISIPHQTPRIDRAREDFLFHYKDRTF